MRVRPGTTIAATVAVLLGGWYGYRYWQAQAVTKMPTPPVAPGRFTLLGVKPTDEYSILVANRTAYLTTGSGADTFAPTDSGTAGKRISTPDLLASKGGDTDALGRLVMSLNGLKVEDAPPEPALWPQKDVEAAINGDETLRAKLERDLALPLRPGGPQPPALMKSLNNGIVVRIDVPIRCDTPDGRKTLVAHVNRPFRPVKVLEWEAKYEKDFYSADTLLRLWEPMARESDEDIASSLRALYSKSHVEGYAAKVEYLLDNTFIVLTERHLTWARSEEVPPAAYQRHPTYTLHMGLTPEGRARLWKFSTVYGGRKVLVVIDGVALQGSELTEGLNVPKFYISKLPDRRRVEEIVGVVNARSAARTGQRVEFPTTNDIR